MWENDSTVYVVDDDRSVREALANLIRSVGFDVQKFTSASEFLDSKLANSPACLVLDVRMPGLSGLDLQRQLAQMDIQIPIIFITGHGDIEMSVRTSEITIKLQRREVMQKMRARSLADLVRMAGRIGHSSAMSSSHTKV